MHQNYCELVLHHYFVIAPLFGHTVWIELQKSSSRGIRAATPWQRGNVGCYSLKMIIWWKLFCSPTSQWQEIRRLTFLKAITRKKTRKKKVLTHVYWVCFSLLLVTLSPVFITSVFSDFWGFLRTFSAFVGLLKIFIVCIWVLHSFVFFLHKDDMKIFKYYMSVANTANICKSQEHMLKRAAFLFTQSLPQCFVARRKPV